MWALDKCDLVYGCSVSRVFGPANLRGKADGYFEYATILLTAASLLDRLEGKGSVRLLCIVGDPTNKKRLRYAGADLVASPLELLGTSLANKATGGIRGKLANITRISEDLNIVELPVQVGSDLAGKTLGESQVGQRSGAKIIGVWTNGEFVSDPGPATLIDEHSVLVASGGDQELDKLMELTLAGKRPMKFPRTALIAGFNQVGKKAWENLNPDIQIVAQATSEEMVNKMYRAGADYVLSVAMVVGRMTARVLLGEEVFDYNKRIRIIKSPLPPEFAHKNLAEINLRKETGCTVLAVERSGTTYPDIGADLEFKEGDEIILSGTDENIRQFYQEFESVEPEF